jgi:HK97 family phage portal protein
MGIWQKIFSTSASSGELRADSSTRDPLDDWWYRSSVGLGSAAGVTVTVDRALKVPIVRDCVSVLQDSVAQLPLKLYERDGNTRKPATNHPLYDVLHSRPNDSMTAHEYWGQCVWDLAVHGNHLAEIVPGPRGPVDQLIWIEWGWVTVQKMSDGSARYEIREPGKEVRRLMPDEVWHLKALPLKAGGLVGTSTIEDGSEAIGASIALQDFASRYFQNDATPPFIIKHPGHFATDEDKGNFLKAIKRWWGGKNRGSPGVLEHGMEVMKLGANNEESQFLETRKENNYDVARLWHIPPHKVGLMDKSSFNNIEHQSREFVTDTLMPWLSLIEKAIARDLLIAPDKYFAEFNVDSLLRGDLKSRYEAYGLGRQWGFLSVNDIRKSENMDPVPDGDQYLVPINMQPAGTVSRDNGSDGIGQATMPAGPEKLNGHNHTEGGHA